MTTLGATISMFTCYCLSSETYCDFWLLALRSLMGSEVLGTRREWFEAPVKRQRLEGLARDHCQL